MGLIKIKSIKHIGKQDVYNMEVKDHHNFSINGGLIVHNCYDGAGYGLISYHAEKSKTLPKEQGVIARHKNELAKKTRTKRLL